MSTGSKLDYLVPQFRGRKAGSLSQRFLWNIYSYFTRKGAIIYSLINTWSNIYLLDIRKEKVLFWSTHYLLKSEKWDCYSEQYLQVYKLERWEKLQTLSSFPGQDKLNINPQLNCKFLPLQRDFFLWLLAHLYRVLLNHLPPRHTHTQKAKSGTSTPSDSDLQATKRDEEVNHSFTANLCGRSFWNKPGLLWR